MMKGQRAKDRAGAEEERAKDMANERALRRPKERAKPKERVVRWAPRRAKERVIALRKVQAAMEELLRWRQWWH